MQKKEIVYRQLLSNPETTQLELAKILNVSLSTVNNAILPLRGMGAVQVNTRKLRVIDKEKLLLFWASIRNLQNDIIYHTRVDLPVNQIEKNMPSKVLFTAYSGYKFRHKDVPADYSEVYIYTYDLGLDSIKSRYPESGKRANLFVLKADKQLVKVSEKGIVPDHQIFVDLWNLPEWYAKEFVIKLKERLL
jgi:hypothetical protein